MSSNQVMLKLTTRPLRLAYVASNRDHVLQAVRLYTHLWGGAANYIVPFPDKDEEEEFIQFFVSNTPDIVLIPDDIDHKYIQGIISKLPMDCMIINSQLIDDHIHGQSSIHIYDGILPHMGLILEKTFPNSISNSNIFVYEPNSTSSFIQALQHGLPTKSYSEYIIKYLGATQLQPSNSITSLIYTGSIFSHWISPLGLTLKKCRVSTSDIFAFSSNSLWIYLDDEEKIDASVAYWNSTGSARVNRMILPRKDFFVNIDNCLQNIFDINPRIKNIDLIVDSNKLEADELYKKCTEFCAIKGFDVSIRVVYGEFKYRAVSQQITTGEEIVETRIVHEDDSVRFQPQAPTTHGRKEIFAYTAEVTLSSGTKLTLPYHYQSSILLSNKQEYITKFYSNTDETASFRLRPPKVRPTYNGITGLTHSGNECYFYIHNADFIVSNFTRGMGLLIKPNPHTRYAQGFIKKFGAFQEVIKVFRNKGISILTALIVRRSEQSGLVFDQIVSYLQKHKKMSNAKGIVEEQLPKLLWLGLVRRGYPLTCPHCDLTDWYSIEHISEKNECFGCGSIFSLSLKARFAYEINELAKRFIEEGGYAILEAANALYTIDNRGMIAFGGNIYQENSNTNIAEVDLLWLSEEVFGIVECKSCISIGNNEIQQFRDSLIKNIEKVALIGNINFVILAISTIQDPIQEELFTMFQEVVDLYQDKYIGIHLLLNGNIHLMGNVQSRNIGDIDTNDLIVRKAIQKKVKYIGKSPQVTSFGGIGSMVDEDVLENWVQSHKVAFD